MWPSHQTEYLTLFCNEPFPTDVTRKRRISMKFCFYEKCANGEDIQTKLFSYLFSFSSYFSSSSLSYSPPPPFFLFSRSFRPLSSSMSWPTQLYSESETKQAKHLLYLSSRNVDTFRYTEPQEAEFYYCQRKNARNTLGWKRLCCTRMEPKNLREDCKNVTSLTPIRVVPGSNLVRGPATLKSSRFSSVSPAESRNSTLKEATTVSFHIPPNSSLTIIQMYIVRWWAWLVLRRKKRIKRKGG